MYVMVCRHLSTVEGGVWRGKTFHCCKQWVPKHPKSKIAGCLWERNIDWTPLRFTKHVQREAANTEAISNFQTGNYVVNIWASTKEKTKNISWTHRQSQTPTRKISLLSLWIFPSTRNVFCKFLEPSFASSNTGPWTAVAAAVFNSYFSPTQARSVRFGNVWLLPNHAASGFQTVPGRQRLLHMTPSQSFCIHCLAFSFKLF